MIPLIENQLALLKEACRRHGVARLEVFGSAADPARFDPEHSDVDFIVRFFPGTELGPWMGVYFDLRDQLRQLLGMPVELVMESALRDPLFLREANRTRRLIYAAENTEAA
jgi:predicted nucleotidyltransferase